MRRTIVLLAALAALGFTTAGCTDAERSRWASFGKPHVIRMYSGGTLIKEWKSTGKVDSLSESDGWQFRDAATGEFVRVSGDVIINSIEAAQ